MKTTIGLILLCVCVAGMAVADTTVTFQQGTAGYAGAVDTYVKSDNSGPNGTSDSIQMNSGTIRQGLLRFDGIFGGGAIPAGSIIKSATLTIVGHTSSSGGGGNLHRLLSSATTDGWSNSTMWNDLVAGINVADTE